LQAGFRGETGLQLWTLSPREAICIRRGIRKRFRAFSFFLGASSLSDSIFFGDDIN
jgi:hypothetical protein